MPTVQVACPGALLEKYGLTGSESDLKALENRKSAS
jgi:hypothetical protein